MGGGLVLQVESSGKTLKLPPFENIIERHGGIFISSNEMDCPNALLNTCTT